MEIAEIDSLDWSAPWLAPIAELGRAIAASADWRSRLNRVADERDVRNHGGQRISFVNGDAAGAEAYEASIARTGQVPTRPNLHDLFNALIFMHMPRAKSQLNRLQSSAIDRDGIRAVRGPTRDAATLIDENAVLLITERTDLIAALRRHDWPALFIQQRAAWREVQVRVFGHALLEKLVHPYKAITAHALHVALMPAASIADIDRCTSSMLDESLTPELLMPLPVMGIPGWCAQNTQHDFYLDENVFRPAKMRRPFNPEKRTNETRRT